MKLSGLPLPRTMYERAPMLPGMIPMSPSRARTRSLARDEYVLAVVMFPRHVVVVATHDFHIGFERRDLSRALHRRDQVAHHQFAVGQRVVLRPEHRADVVL